MPGPQQRAAALDRLRAMPHWDVLVVGGGASGLGCAVDAAARGYRTLLVERGDFAGGTSSRSTKLIHGGVRYLRQGDLALVRRALVERARLLANAAPLVRPLPFVIPAHSRADLLRFAAGLKLYDLLAGARGVAPSATLGHAQTLAALPGLRDDGVVGGVRYWDAQFDDARLAIALMRSAVDLGATCLNYCAVTGLLKSGGKVRGACLRDAESGETFEAPAAVVVNAAGVYADAVRRLDDAGAMPLLTPSQGAHLVVDAGFLPGDAALLVPETEDGRVLFAIPWLGKVLIGTTDTPRDDLPDDPLPFADEVDFLLRAAGRVLARPPTRADVRSAFAGLRPLLGRPAGATATAALSREHIVHVAGSGLVTVAGGKWTTYRWMAEQVIDRAAAVAGLPPGACVTHGLPLHAAAGDEAGLPGADRRLHPALPWSEATVRFAVRHEAARTVEDVLARRTRACFVDAFAAGEAAVRVGEIIAEELSLSPSRQAALVAAACAQAARCALA